MNKYQQLKDQLKELGKLILDIVRDALSSIMGKVKPLAEVKKQSLKQSPSRQALIGFMALALFYFAAKFLVMITGGSVSGVSPVFWSQSQSRALGAAGTFVISDFENDADVKKWSLKSASAKINDGKGADATRSLRVMMLGGGDVSGILLNHYFDKAGAVRDWSHFSHFEIFIRNTRNGGDRLILQIKDGRGARFKEDMALPANEGKLFRFPISKIEAKINVRDIDQLNIFRWDPKGDREYYFDDIRLVKAESGEKAAAAEDRPKISIDIKKARPVNRLDYGFQSRKSSWFNPSQPGTVRVPFIVKNETPWPCHRCPVEGGMPFPMGEIRDPGEIRLYDANMKPLPIQSRLLSRWPDGSVKWAGIHFLADLAGNIGAGYFIQYGGVTDQGTGLDDKMKGRKEEQTINQNHPVVLSSSRPFVNGAHSPLSVTDDPSAIRISNGSVQAVLSKKSFYLFESLSLDENGDQQFDVEEEMIRKAPLVVGFRGKEYRTDLSRENYRLSIEDQGPERVSLRASGWFQSKDGKKFCQVIVRYYFYAGTDRIQVNHTLIYTGYPENLYHDAYKGLKLPENEMIEYFGTSLPLNFPGAMAYKVRSGFEGNRFAEWIAASFDLVQLGWEKNIWKQDGNLLGASEQPAGWFDVSRERRGIGLYLRDFRENFPKAYRFDAKQDRVFIDLWPKEAGPLDLSTTSSADGPDAKARGSAFGLAKTHEMFIYPYRTPVDEKRALDVLNSAKEPLMLRNNPYWISASGALGRLYPVVPRFATEEKMLDKLFDWAARHPKDFKWYGMINFGDTLSWHRHEDESGQYGDDGWHPVGRWGWYNCEGVGTHTGSLLQFARTGAWKYFRFGRDNARHIMDVDTVHYNTVAEDPRLRNLISDEFSKVGSMHRHNADHWGDRNEETSHTSVVGILYYYYLTGDERALEVAKEIGEFYLIEPFTYTRHPDIAPMRSLANALWGDVLLYEQTGDERFKQAADRLVEVFLKGQQSDGSFLETFNPLDHSWNGKKHRLYMEGYALGAFMAYHELTQDEEVKTMLLKMLDFLGGSPEIIYGNAYAYFLTGKQEYVDRINKGMNTLLHNKQVSSDSMMDGLIYKKMIYHRPMAFLHSAPYAFEALEISERAKA